MTLDEILASLFPDGHDVKNDEGVLLGSAHLRSGGQALVIGVADRTPLGVDEAIRLSGYVLASLAQGSGPILVLVDSDSQRMSKRDELARPERVSRPSRQVAHLCGHAWPADHRPSVRPLGCRRASSPRRWQPACWWGCRAPTPR